MKKLIVSLLFGATLVSGYESDSGQSQDLYHFSDAVRFAELLQSSAELPDAEAIQTAYLDHATRGVEIFTPNRIENAKNLHAELHRNPEAYLHAVERCLPAVKALEAEAVDVLRRAAELLQQKEVAPIYMVFGAMNSGGTAGPDGVVIGLEVACQEVQNLDEANALIANLVAHEIVHVYQIRNVSSELASMRPTVLSQSLVEGLADYIAVRLQGKSTQSEAERYDYVVQHEAELWHEFSAQLDSHTLQPWMYQRQVEGRPADLGYSIGRRIVEAYVANSVDEAAALKELLSFSDPHEIVRKSGYAESLD
ncbi:DUF2268 domain-containing putative Zn-dependent protease [Pseudidiomarina sp.]|uniref:DUF2268 domain-containing putative Zn-dependent protease n=1 Tax=Pseudidiomarina sp. TaxID=2081707 RepID=UPI00299F44DB|nr:DUF2268 domain-containing putative Zn-dependent protease [Pseudidiomarina sp.]MDX1705565.1 DUF2268 domain-containing putative Zn-dependent protease [Pseudidiomarina sp.]